MKLTPQEIRQQRFHVKFRGFDPEEVDTFLEMVANELEALIQGGKAAGQEAVRLQEECQGLRLEVQRLREALEAGERGKAQTLEVLRAEASETRAQAAREAQAIIESARHERAKAQDAVEALAEQRRQMIEQLRSLLETQLRLLEMEGTETPSAVPPRAQG
ncbi:MAG: DivIVA domain-containing protein [bacterium]|nr:DivIVA domain-containing protein [bacterium]